MEMDNKFEAAKKAKRELAAHAGDVRGRCAQRPKTDAIYPSGGLRGARSELRLGTGW